MSLIMSQGLEMGMDGNNEEWHAVVLGGCVCVSECV